MRIFVLIIFVLSGVLLTVNSCAPSKNIRSDDNELIVVFKKEIELQKAVEILEKSRVKYKEGMDSSKGKQYFSNTGPKFILTFRNINEKEKFLSGFSNREEIYEIYIPNWTIHKD